METPALQSYYRINAENYRALIDNLLAEVEKLEPAHAADITEARRYYFEIAIAKSTELTDLPSYIALLSAEDIIAVADTLPDKEANGWYGTTSLSTEDRQAFIEAAAARPLEMKWDNLFPEGENDRILLFSGSPQSSEGKIATYLAQFNDQAARNLAEARQQDIQAKEQDPQARPVAGRSIQQRQLRRDPKDPSKLQTLNPNKDGEFWEPGPRLGKFLQDQFEWELYDIFRSASETPLKATSQPSQETADAPVAFDSLTNHEQQKADELFNTESLRVMVSRDPQKIGEMSTGQRWHSCMAKDGVNFRYVNNDIRAGSLVAYVIHRDDPEARYPLMRQLIKPFRNEAGETILVPAKVYGGHGGENSLTVDGLQHTLNDFVAPQNAGKTGAYHMDARLYADGQAQVARLQGQWSPEDIRQALHKYQQGAVQEWLVELKSNKELLARNEKGPHGEDPGDTIKKLKSNIRRVHDAQDFENGLPRMFFREMSRTSIGSIPSPRSIVQVIADDADIHAKSNAFKALDKNTWDTTTFHSSADDRYQLSLTALLSAEEGSEQEQRAADIWETEAKNLPVVVVKETCQKHSTPGSALDKAAANAAEYLLQNDNDVDHRAYRANSISQEFHAGSFLGSLANTLLLDFLTAPEAIHNDDRLSYAFNVASRTKTGPVNERAEQIFLEALKQLPTPQERVRKAQELLPQTKSESSSDKLCKILLDSALLLESDQQLEIAIKVIKILPAKELLIEACKMALENARYCPDVQRRIEVAKQVWDYSGSNEGAEIKSSAGHLLLDNLVHFNDEQRFSWLSKIHYSFNGNVQLKERSGRIILGDIASLDSIKSRIEHAEKLYEKNDPKTVVYQQALTLMIENIPQLPTPEEQIKKCRSIFRNPLPPQICDIILRAASQITPEKGIEAARWVGHYAPLDSIKLNACAFILDNVSHLSEPAARIAAAKEVLWNPVADTGLIERSGTIILDNIAHLPTIKERVEIARNIHFKCAQDTPLRDQAGHIALDNILLLTDIEKRIFETSQTLYNSSPDSLLRERVLKMLTDDIPELPVGLERAKIAMGVCAETHRDSPQYKVMTVVFTRDIFEISAEDRVQLTKDLSEAKKEGQTALSPHLAALVDEVEQTLASASRCAAEPAKTNPEVQRPKALIP